MVQPTLFRLVAETGTSCYTERINTKCGKASGLASWDNRGEGVLEQKKWVFSMYSMSFSRQIMSRDSRQCILGFHKQTFTFACKCISARTFFYGPEHKNTKEDKDIKNGRSRRNYELPQTIILEAKCKEGGGWLENLFWGIWFCIYVQNLGKDVYFSSLRQLAENYF